MGCGCGKKNKKAGTSAAATGNATQFDYLVTLSDGTQQTFGTRLQANQFATGKSGSIVQRVAKVSA